MPAIVQIINHIIDQKIQSISASVLQGTQRRFESATMPALQENTDAMEQLIVTLFNDIEYVQTISYRQSDDKFILVIVYDSHEHEKAFDQIEDGLIKLEDVLPEYEFEPWILHSSELEEWHLHGTKTILQQS